jgi:hypothetical protein
MKKPVKIVWKTRESFYDCGFGFPKEKSTLTLTEKTIRFERKGEMNGYLGGECPISDVKETWEVVVVNPDYQESFLSLAKAAEEALGNYDERIDFDGPIQSLRLVYEDGSKKEVREKIAILLDRAFLKEKIGAFLPERMVEAIFGDQLEEAIWESSTTRLN